MKQSDTDPLHAKILELTQDLNEHVITLRDYATSPGNAWLAKGQIQTIATLLSDIENVVDQIRRTDAGPSH